MKLKIRTALWYSDDIRYYHEELSSLAKIMIFSYITVLLSVIYLGETVTTFVILFYIFQPLLILLSKHKYNKEQKDLKTWKPTKKK